MTVRQPTEHVVHVVSCCDRSHGRALNRYGRGGQRADRADLDGVAGEVRGERFVGERHHLGVVAPADEVDQLVAGDLVGEARAAVAQDAALTVEEHEVADRDRLLVVALLLDEPALAGAVAERLVLQRALAALVAHRTVERMVGEQQLEHALLGALDAVGDSVLTTWPSATGVMHDTTIIGPRGPSTSTMHWRHMPTGVHPRVVAEVRDVVVGAQRRQR